MIAQQSNRLQFGAFRYGLSRNLGDEVQTLAALQFLPTLDTFVDRDCPTVDPSAPPLHCVYNGWFKHEGARNWPPPPSIVPYFTSFFVSSGARELVSDRWCDFFRRFAPIGCRSLATVRAFEAIGVDAYFSGCLTLTLARPPVERTDAVVIVDAPRRLLHRLIAQKTLSRARYLSHHYAPVRGSSIPLRLLQELPRGYALASRVEGLVVPLSPAERNRRKLAEASRRLMEYARAKWVITGKLHVALPCLAMGTPVVLLYEGLRSDPRLEGLHPLLRCFDGTERIAPIDDDEEMPNPTAYQSVADALEVGCRRWTSSLGVAAMEKRRWWEVVSAQGDC